MARIAMSLLGVCLLGACAGEISVPEGDGQSTGQSTHEGGGGLGGTGGAGGSSGVGGAVTAATCEDLQADLSAKVAAARACTSVGTWDECDYSASVVDECGCSAPANHVHTSAIEAAKAAREALEAAGCALMCDPQTCYERYADPDYQGGCRQTSPGVGVCVWVGAA